MSFATNQSQQISLFDATANLTDREKRLLEKSWAKYFAENIFPGIDEAPFLYFTATVLPDTIHQ